MKFVLSIENERFTSFCQRANEAFGEETAFTRINITPENLPVEKPKWWVGADDRWALTQAILTALKQAQEAGEDCEIYEDDCIFAPDFATKRAAMLADVPDNWDMIYFGGQLLARQFYPLQEIDGNETVLLCKNAHRNHAWICRSSSISRLTAWLETPYWPCTQTCDWRIGYLQMQDDFHVYIPKTGWICGQGANHSQLDHVDYPDRWWHFTEPEATEEKALWEAFSIAQKTAAEKTSQSAQTEE
ncbi:MAG: hypothetical protein Q4D62_12955 [Planctomycetia bacterium]|nr:hypothetical protein [Planctomycetia bacterium]